MSKPFPTNHSNYHAQRSYDQIGPIARLETSGELKYVITQRNVGLSAHTMSHSGRITDNITSLHDKQEYI